MSRDRGSGAKKTWRKELQQCWTMLKAFVCPIWSVLYMCSSAGSSAACEGKNANNCNHIRGGCRTKKKALSTIWSLAYSPFVSCFLQTPALLVLIRTFYCGDLVTSPCAFWFSSPTRDLLEPCAINWTKHYSTSRDNQPLRQRKKRQSLGEYSRV